MSTLIASDTAVYPGSRMPDIKLNTLSATQISLAKTDWHVILIYRGIHCSLCALFITDLEKHRKLFAEEGIALTIVSADDKYRAQDFATLTGFGGDVAYGLFLVAFAISSRITIQLRAHIAFPSPSPQTLLY